MDAHDVLERERSISRHPIPRLGCPGMHVVDAVQVVVLDVPGEPTEHHGDVEHRRCDAGDVLPQEPQKRSGAPGGAAHVPRRVPNAPVHCGGRARGAGGEPRARHVAGVLDADGAVGHGAPEERLDVERRELPGGGDVEVGEEPLAQAPCPGLEMRERVAVGGLPDVLDCRARPARAEADLLVAGGECRGGIVGVEVDEGAGEVGERGPLGRRRVRRDHLADTEGRGGGLDLEDVGDGVGELRRGGVELGRHGEGLEPGGHLVPRRRRHRGGRREEGIDLAGGASLAHSAGAGEVWKGSLRIGREKGGRKGEKKAGERVGFTATAAAVGGGARGVAVSRCLAGTVPCGCFICGFTLAVFAFGRPVFAFLFWIPPLSMVAYDCFDYDGFWRRDGSVIVRPYIK